MAKRVTGSQCPLPESCPYITLALIRTCEMVANIYPI